MSITRLSQATTLAGNKTNTANIQGHIPYSLATSLFVGRNARWNSATVNVSGQWYFWTNTYSGLTPPTGAVLWTVLAWVPELKLLFRIGGNTSICQSWDPVTNAWTSKATPPITDMTCVRGAYDPVTRKIYLCGMSSTVGPVVFHYAYDPFANTWSAALSTGTTNVHILQYQSHGVVFNNNIYYWAGTNSSGTQQDSMAIYNIAGNSWSLGLAGSVANGGPGARYAASAGLITYGLQANKIAIVGGSNAADDRCWFYNPIANTWSNPGAYTGQNDANNNAVNSALWMAVNHNACATGRYMHIMGGDKSGSNRQYMHVAFDTHTAKIYTWYRGTTQGSNMVFLGGTLLSSGDGGFVGYSLTGGMVASIIQDAIGNDLGIG